MKNFLALLLTLSCLQMATAEKACASDKSGKAAALQSHSMEQLEKTRATLVDRLNDLLSEKAGLTSKAKPGSGKAPAVEYRLLSKPGAGGPSSSKRKPVVFESASELSRQVELAGLSEKQIAVNQEVLSLDRKILEVEKERFSRLKKPVVNPDQSSKESQLAFRLRLFKDLKPAVSYYWQARKLELTGSWIQTRDRLLKYWTEEEDANRQFIEAKIADSKSGTKRSELRQNLLKKLFLAQSFKRSAKTEATVLKSKIWQCTTAKREQVLALCRRVATLERLQESKSTVPELPIVTAMPIRLSQSEYSTGVILDKSIKERPRINATANGSPAGKSSLAAGDELIFVNDAPVACLSAADAYLHLKGKKDGVVRVTVLTDSGLRTTELSMSFRPRPTTHPMLLKRLRESRKASNRNGQINALLDMAAYAEQFSRDSSVAEEDYIDAIKIAGDDKDTDQIDLDVRLNAFCKAGAFFLKQYGQLSRAVALARMARYKDDRVGNFDAQASKMKEHYQRCYERVLECTDQSPGDKGLSEPGVLAEMVAGLAGAFQEQYLFKRIEATTETEKLLTRATSLVTSDRPADRLRAAGFLRRLGILYSQQDSGYDRAIDALTRSLSLYEGVLPDESREVEEVQEALVPVLIRSKRSTELVGLLSNRLKTIDRIFAEDSGIDPETIIKKLRSTLMPLARACIEANDDARALTALVRLISLKGEKSTDPDTLLLAGECCLRLDKDDRALAYLSDALGSGLDELSKARCVNSLTKLYLKTGRKSEASVLCLTQLQYLTKALDSSESATNVLVDTAAKTASLLERTGERMRANKLYLSTIRAIKGKLDLSLAADRKAGAVSSRSSLLTDRLKSVMESYSRSLVHSGERQRSRLVKKSGKELAESLTSHEPIQIEWLGKSDSPVL